MHYKAGCEAPQREAAGLIVLGMATLAGVICIVLGLVFLGGAIRAPFRVSSNSFGGANLLPSIIVAGFIGVSLIWVGVGLMN